MAERQQVPRCTESRPEPNPFARRREQPTRTKASFFETPASKMREGRTSELWGDVAKQTVPAPALHGRAASIEAESSEATIRIMPTSTRAICLCPPKCGSLSLEMQLHCGTARVKRHNPAVLRADQGTTIGSDMLTITRERAETEAYHSPFDVLSSKK